MKAAIIILILACAGLTAALLYKHNEAVDQKKADEAIKNVTKLSKRISDKFRERKDYLEGIA